jgi:hypothetical protein
MAHQRRTDTPSLVLIEHGEGHLSFFWLHDDVASAANYHGSATLFHYCNQRHMFNEVDIQKECDFVLCEAALYSKETAKETLCAGAADGCDKIGPIVRF